MNRVKLDYDKSSWKIEILSTNVGAVVIFSFIGDCFGYETYPHKLEPFIRNTIGKVSVLKQVKDNEFIIVYEYGKSTYKYEKLIYKYGVYHVVVDPYSLSETGIIIPRVLHDLTEVKIFETDTSFVVFAYDNSSDSIPLIYSALDRMELSEWLINLEEDWNKMVDKICIDTYDDRIGAASVMGHTVGDFEMNFSINLNERCFADGFRVMPLQKDASQGKGAKSLKEEILETARAKSSCKCKLYKREIQDLVSFSDVDKFIKAECDNLEVAEFYMNYGGFYIAGEKLPILEQRYFMQTSIWEETAKQKILEANNLSEIGAEEKKLPPLFTVFRMWPETKLRLIDDDIIIEYDDGLATMIEHPAGEYFCGFYQVGPKAFIGTTCCKSSEGVFTFFPKYYRGEDGAIRSVRYGPFPCSLSKGDCFCIDDDTIYVEQSGIRYSILEDKALDPPVVINLESYLGHFFAKDNNTGEGYVVEVRYEGDIYFLVSMREKEEKRVLEIFDKVYNAYTGGVIGGVTSYDQIKDMVNQNKEWEEWAQTEISNIEP